MQLGLGAGRAGRALTLLLCAGPDEPPRDVRCEATAAGELRVRWAPPRRAPPQLAYDVIYAPLDTSLDLGRDPRGRSRDGRPARGCYRRVGWILPAGDEGPEAQSSPGPRVQPAGGDGAVLRLRARGNYSVSVRAHFESDRAPPPTSSPIICATAADGTCACAF